VADSSIVYLMYHELELPGRSLCQREPGYVRYVVREQNFQEQMAWLHSSNLTGVGVSQALHSPRPGSVAITFDDGCETDLIVAVPLLRALNFGATFYITLNFLGQPGYMAPGQVRQLSDAGFDVGCHSMTHPYLTELDEVGLRREIVDAKTKLEQMIGRPVVSFSCPGGRWNRRVAEVAMQGGYHSVATSRIAANTPSADPYALARVAIMRGTPLSSFKATCLNHGLWKRQLLTFAQMGAQSMLGNTLYDRLRGIALGRG